MKANRSALISIVTLAISVSMMAWQPANADENSTDSPASNDAMTDTAAAPANDAKTDTAATQTNDAKKDAAAAQANDAKSDAAATPTKSDESASKSGKDDKVAATASPDPKRPYKEEAIKHYNRGHDLHQQGFFNQAITEYKAAIGADDRMEEAWTNLGLIYAAQRNYSKAMDAFKKSLALNPRRPNALNGMGTVLYAQNKFDQAMEKWKQAIAIEPHFASAYYNMGNALENEKDFHGAVDAYANALAIAPNMADAYYRIGSIYAKQKHAAQADVLLTRAIELQPTGDFVHDAKKTLASLAGEFSHDAADEPEVKMNIMAPPTTEAATKAGGS